MADGDELLQLLNGLRDMLLADDPTVPVVIGPASTNIDRVIALTPYPIPDPGEQDTGNRVTGVQFRIRGAATGGVVPMVREQARVNRLVANLRRRTFGSVVIVLAWRQTSAQLGLDGQGRPEIADSYYFRTDQLALR